MKQGWQRRPLREVCEIRPPKAEAREKAGSNGVVSFAAMEHLGIDRKFLIPSEIKLLSEVVGSYTYFGEGDVLLAKITPCFENGKLGIAKNLKSGVGFGSSEFLVLRPSSNLDNEFLYYFLVRPEFRVEGAARMGGAVGQQRVPKEFVESYKIPIPPLVEQQRIVGILDKAFEAIATAKANTEKNLQNARELLDAQIHSIAGEEVCLGDLVNITTGKLDANAAVENGRFPFFTCSRDTYAIDTYAFDCEAILLAGNNAVGDFNVKHYKGKFNAYQRTYVITVNENKRVLYRFLYAQMVKCLAKFKAQSVGVGTKFLKLGMIKEMKIPLPTLSEQEKIVSKIDGIRAETQRLESIYRRKLAALEELKKSLLHHAFSGQL